MSVGDFINKAKDLVSGHPDQARQALDRVEQTINERTGGKYADKIAKGQDMLEDRLGVPHGQQGDPAPSDDRMQGGSAGAVNEGQSPGPGLG